MWETFQELPHKILWFLEYHSGKNPNPAKISPFCKFLLTEKKKLCIMLKRSPHSLGRSLFVNCGEWRISPPSAVE